MIKAQIILYPIVYNKNNMKYQILSDTDDTYSECSESLVDDIPFDVQVGILFESYFDLDQSYIRFLTLDPAINEKKLIIPIYCLVPYLTKIKKGFLLPVHPHAIHIPNIRKILSVV
jgi:hypothetical protein